MNQWTDSDDGTEVIFHCDGDLSYCVTNVETDVPATVEISDKPFVQSTKRNPFFQWLKSLFG